MSLIAKNNMFSSILYMLERVFEVNILDAILDLISSRKDFFFNQNKIVNTNNLSDHLLLLIL